MIKKEFFIIKEGTPEHANDPLDSNSRFEHTLKDGSKIITIDKTYCWDCPFFKSTDEVSGWKCDKFTAKENDFHWYDGPLRLIECMEQTGDWESEKKTIIQDAEWLSKGVEAE